jgi:hypothetical protein
MIGGRPVVIHSIEWPTFSFTGQKIKKNNKSRMESRRNPVNPGTSETLF